MRLVLHKLKCIKSSGEVFPSKEDEVYFMYKADSGDKAPIIRSTHDNAYFKARDGDEFDNLNIEIPFYDQLQFWLMDRDEGIEGTNDEVLGENIFTSARLVNNKVQAFSNDGEYELTYSIKTDTHITASRNIVICFGTIVCFVASIVIMPNEKEANS